MFLRYRFNHGESGGDVYDRISDWCARAPPRRRAAHGARRVHGRGVPACRWSSMLREFARHGGGRQYPNYVIVTHGLTMRCLFMCPPRPAAVPAPVPALRAPALSPARAGRGDAF